jgi:hypothetical protein
MYCKEKAFPLIYFKEQNLSGRERKKNLKGLSHEIDFKNVDENGQILALTRAAAGF